ncbi:putative membrane protein [Erwinia phage Hena1]|uniref:Putative membrane protein n=1 Tax=Erwinia phage Hena1 TaxID=2678601 RepID=A0A6B9JBB1_9CAUD|nr:hypothetical protein HWC84_gp198 [Erwinia phage Hena1]QGZ16316.1 putative membrane protein [Erwinia phage Hena1]
MIASALYFLCFAVLLFHTEKGIRVMSVFGMTHILSENGLYWWFTKHIQYFDWNLYFTGCWFLDIGLLFASACVLQGWRKKLTLAVSVPILFSQMLALQYPFVLPEIFGFVVDSSYQTSMEMIILCASFQDNTIKEWLKTVVVISALVLARFIPMLLH